MKRASGKRHPDEKHSPGEETSRPQLSSHLSNLAKWCKLETAVELFAPFESNLKTKKRASGKRHPDGEHSPGEELFAVGN